MKVLLKPLRGDNQPNAATPTNLQSTPVAEPMTDLVRRLAELRETYFSELKAARDKVKKNFLR